MVRYKKWPDVRKAQKSVLEILKRNTTTCGTVHRSFEGRSDVMARHKCFTFAKASVAFTLRDMVYHLTSRQRITKLPRYLELLTTSNEQIEAQARVQGTHLTRMPQSRSYPKHI